MVQFSPTARRRTPAQKGRTVAVVGPQGSGRSTLIKLVASASRHRCVEVDPTALLEHLGGLQVGCEVQFTKLRTPAELLQLIEGGHLARAHDGVVVKVIPDSWPNPPQDEAWAKEQARYEQLMEVHGVQRAAVVNKWQDPLAACIGLARAAKLKS